jgi:hypothetical protein
LIGGFVPRAWQVKLCTRQVVLRKCAKKPGRDSKGRDAGFRRRPIPGYKTSAKE